MTIAMIVAAGALPTRTEGHARPSPRVTNKTGLAVSPRTPLHLIVVNGGLTYLRGALEPDPARRGPLAQFTLRVTFLTADGSVLYSHAGFKVSPGTDFLLRTAALPAGAAARISQVVIETTSITTYEELHRSERARRMREEKEWLPVI